MRSIAVPAAPPGQPEPERVATGRFFVTDVYRGLEPEVARGRVKSIRIMEQLPKTVNTTWYRVYDQGPLMSGGTHLLCETLLGLRARRRGRLGLVRGPRGKGTLFPGVRCRGPGTATHDLRDAAHAGRGPGLHRLS